MDFRRYGICVAKSKFRVGQHVRISKEKMKLAKSAEHNFSTEIFRIANVIERRPRPFYELEDLNGTPIDGQLNQKKLTLFRVTRRTIYKMHKIIDPRFKRGILEDLVRWRGYSKDFDSCIPAPSVKDVRISETFLRDVDK